MVLQFKFVCEQEWPSLAWIAECVNSDSVVSVRHGPQVETRNDWFCEAVWDGEFKSGDFDQTDLVFGSGARLRDERLVFVSSASTVDRLQFFEHKGKLWISNSLACLLAASGAEIDVTYERYPDFFRSIVRGIDKYERRLPTYFGRLELTYFRNLAWDGQQLEEAEKPFPVRNFCSFQSYHRFLQVSFRQIAENMRSDPRNHRYEMVGGLSSGYDSATAVVLAREVGMTRIFSFHKARGGQADHGKEVAAILGLDITMVNRRGWQQQTYAEIPYFAATGLGADVIFSSAQDVLRGRVLVSGFHGDKMWAKDTTALGPDIVRGDASGLSFTEHRLSLCCLHLPIAFMGVRQIHDIHALSNSLELATWDVPGDYSRPICRRIVEEAGVPRPLFGTTKKAATNLFRKGEASLTERTRTAYHEWLINNKKQWVISKKKTPRVPGKMLLTFRNRHYFVTHLFQKLNHVLPGSAYKWIIQKDSQFQRWLNRRNNVAAYLFPWSVKCLADMYRSTKTNWKSSEK